MFLPTFIPTHPQTHSVRPREGAHYTLVPSVSTRAAISLKSTWLQVQEGGSPSVQAGSPSPPALHQLGQLSPPRSPPPIAAGPLGLVLAPGSLGRVGTPCLRLLQSEGLFWTPGQPPRAKPLCPSSPSLWGLIFCGVFSISFACGSLNINMYKNPPPCLLLFQGLLGVWLMGVSTSSHMQGRGGAFARRMWLSPCMSPECPRLAVIGGWYPAAPVAGV